MTSRLPSHQELLDQLRAKLLQEVPGGEDYYTRSAWLRSIPHYELVPRNDKNNSNDLHVILDYLDKLGKLRSKDKWAVEVFVLNAIRDFDQFDIYSKVKVLLEQYVRSKQEHLDSRPREENIPSVSYPKIVKPEILIFEGRDERLPHAFVENALLTGRSVARLFVPRFFMNPNDRPEPGGGITGTGWLVTPGLLFTNHHVIAARFFDEDEPPASQEECKFQAEHAIAWFDYYVEDGERFECRCIELVHSNVELDYALVRVDVTFQADERRPLSIARQRLPLSQRDRLNIVQYPNGGSLKYAIRNNFYSGVGHSKDFIQYFTDTEPGSSGSPVLNDRWRVVGMHHASIETKPGEYKGDTIYKGETIKYLNQGIVIHAILDDLPPLIRQEIRAVQGW